MEQRHAPAQFIPDTAPVCNRQRAIILSGGNSGTYLECKLMTGSTPRVHLWFVSQFYTNVVLGGITSMFMLQLAGLEFFC